MKKIIKRRQAAAVAGVCSRQIPHLIETDGFPPPVTVGKSEGWIDQKIAERDAALAGSTRMSLDTKNRYATLALAGICSSCGQPMPPLSEEEVLERLEACEDDPFECARCSIDALIMAGWEVATFEECLPDFMQDPLKEYILAACERRRAKTESPRREA
jgi:predicted DNA-binding transcriptional regulator AlpA